MICICCQQIGIMGDEYYSLLCQFLKGLLGVPDLSDEVKENLKSMLTFPSFHLKHSRFNEIKIHI